MEISFFRLFFLNVEDVEMFLDLDPWSYLQGKVDFMGYFKLV
jgi:hypothetical protein